MDRVHVRTIIVIIDDVLYQQMYSDCILLDTLSLLVLFVMLHDPTKSMLQTRRREKRCSGKLPASDNHNPTT